MNSPNTIAAQWESFHKAAVAPSAPEIQRSEMRLAFYAGATAMLGITMGIGSDSVSADAGVALLQSLHDEAEAFALNLVNGPR